MKRPRYWLRGILLVGVLLVVGEYVALSKLAPQYVIWAVEKVAGGDVTVDSARLSIPVTTRLSGLRLVNNSPQSAFTIQRAVVWPKWLSVSSRTLWLDAVEMQRPFIRLTRTADGTVLWPILRGAMAAGAAAQEKGSAPDQPLLSSWHARIGEIRIVDGTIEFMDEKPSSPFHAVLDHISIVVGPVILPWESSRQLSFAIRGRFVGEAGSGAPMYCSGWADLLVKDLQASCRLEPLPLAAFDPYFHGTREVQVYGVTLASTSQWSARANELAGRLQLTLGNLSEGDLLIRGRTILDIKKVTSGSEPHLSGQITIAGPLTNPNQWQAQFLPGDDQVQQLVKRLLNHRVEAIRLSLFGQHLKIALEPATAATMTDIEAAGKEIADALDILAMPSTEEPPPPATLPEAPAPTPEVAPSSEAPPSSSSGPPPESPPSSSIPTSSPAPTQ